MGNNTTINIAEQRNIKRYKIIGDLIHDTEDFQFSKLRTEKVNDADHKTMANNFIETVYEYRENLPLNVERTYRQVYQTTGRIILTSQTANITFSSCFVLRPVRCGVLEYLSTLFTLILLFL